MTGCRIGAPVWTDERVATLKSLYADGYSSSEIAAALGHGTTRNAAIGKIHRLLDSAQRAARAEVQPVAAGRQRRHAPGLAHVPAIREMAGAGASDAMIAGKLGLKPEDVRHARRMQGIAGAYVPPASPAMMKAPAIAELAKAGRSDREIGEALQLTAPQVRWVRRQKGIAGNAPKPAPRATSADGSNPLSQEHWFAEGYCGQQGRLDLVSLTLLACRFPVDQAEGPVRYCGDDIAEGSVYCASHAARCTNGRPLQKTVKPGYLYAPVQRGRAA